GQGPWTPWQMFAFAVVGLASGILFQKGAIHKSRIPLSIYGFVAAIVIYGGIINPASVLMMTPKPTAEMILSAYAAGFALDVMHGLATAFFLWLIGEALIEKISRVRKKYGV
ncbi:MAG: ECF transporter S component, partial [Clostridia bacterium]|nr:ECF transporter S component [Clostridia bacterium]